jgi:glucose-1-phosphate adenylyltransferase, glgD subunit
MSSVFGIIQPSNRKFWVEGMEEYRTAGAFSFMGRYRTIDFPISNMSNSDIDRIQVYIKRKPATLTQHLGSGRHYNINSKRGKLQILFSNNTGEHDIYNTDISSYIDNIEVIESMTEKYVLIAPSYMIYKANFAELLNTHKESGADITLLYHTVDNAKDAYLRCNVLDLNKQKGLVSIQENQGTAKSRNIFMETYIMTKDLFVDLVRKAKNTSSLYTLVNIVNDNCNELDIRCEPHRGYFAAITDFKSYYYANLSLINSDYARDLFQKDWPIYTKTNDSCPTKYFETAQIKSSVISNGCLIEGCVENSVIGRDCMIKKGAVVRNSVILSGTTIGEDVHVENHVVDKQVKIEKVKEVIGDRIEIGYIKRNDVI